VRHDEPAIVQHEVADQAVDPLLDLCAELGRLQRELRQRLAQPVRDLHLTADEGALQLIVVVAGHAERRVGPLHAHRQAQHAGRVRPAVHQIAEQDGFAAGRMARHAVFARDIAKLHQQRLQLGAAAVNVADQVERPVLVAAVGPEARALNRRRINFILRAEDADVAEALALQRAERAA